MTQLKASWLDSPLGPLVAVADEKALYLLEFAERRTLEKEIPRLKQLKTTIISGRTKPIESIERELKQYFAGKLTDFHTPLAIIGTPFQKRVWDELKKIPFAETCSYAELATAIGKPTAYRAVAQANGANRFILIYPCHRVINSNGALGGYGAGIERKKWLLDHEKKLI